MGKIRRIFGAQDMTQGKPGKNLMMFSIPLLIGNLAQLLYSTVDSVVVGRYVGDNALAAIGASGPIINLLLLLFMGISVGGGIMVSQYFGAKQRENLSGTVGTTITLAFIVSVIMMIGGTLLSPVILQALDTPEEVIGMATEYLAITFIGIIGPAFYNMFAGILRGVGDSLTPVVFLLLASGINIGLDLLFVIQFGWGVAGVAWATIIAQIISAILSFIKITRMTDVLDVKAKYLKPKGKLVMQLIRLGLPSGLTQGIFSMAAIVVQNLTNSFGPTIMAVSTVVMRVDSFAMMPNFTFGTAMTTYTGQNIGAGRIDRAEEGAKTGMKLGLMVSASLVVLLLIFNRSLMSLFTPTEEIINYGGEMIRILAVGYVGVAVTQILSGVMRGAGATITPMIISIITTVLVRVPVAYGIEYLTRTEGSAMGSPKALFISLLTSWVIGAVLTFIFYRRGKWKNKAITNTATQQENETPLSAEAAMGQS